jgi:integrase
MARTVRNAQLETRSARLRLKPRRKPHRTATAKQGLHLGYRRIAGRNGSWVAFTYQGASGRYAERAFAQADDYSEADGEEVLTYFEAMRRVSGEAPPVRHGRAYTVPDAVSDYLNYLKREKKTATDARAKLSAYVLSYFGERRLVSLTTADFDKWLEWALSHKPRGRLKDGKQTTSAKRARAQKRGKELPPPPPEVPAAERARRRRATLNRVMNSMKAAFNRAADRGHIESRGAWARLQKFRTADSARIARLSAKEARRLLDGCERDFRQLVEAALLTGCRYGELANLQTRDYDPGSGTLLVAESKAGKPRRLPLTDEGQRFFAAITAGKDADARMLTKADGAPWGQSDQFRRMRAACTVAEIVPAVNFHAIRHTFASLLVEAGTPLAFVAEALGQADTRMVSKHYAHLAANVVHDSIRANLPTFGVQIAEGAGKPQP